jgi:hypothetical protein
MAGFRKLYVKEKCLPIKKHSMGIHLELLNGRISYIYMAFTLNVFHNLPDWNSS